VGSGPAVAATTGKSRKYFFFEKKKQKTFIFSVTRTTQSSCDTILTVKSFLVLFFKKEHLAFCRRQ
jgi:hypothetical protein